MIAGLGGGLDEGVDEPVHHRVGGALLEGRHPQADQVAGPRPEAPRGPVGLIAELVDRVLHPGQGVGAQQVGVVDRVGDRLPGDAGQLRDVCQGRRRGRDMTAGTRHHHALPPLIPMWNSGSFQDMVTKADVARRFRAHFGLGSDVGAVL